ncbi:uncharacterized protein K452DRAFT_323173 [Aplosporella prunicola CBS 121167]|uniref:Plasma membrane channel protein n=1 Tax=Aplosporella prunicola CBS 121167 TaxID=1176127 RepID=A0A6A6AXE0_9PEZI|nr:uncharacterized protein K452DRAFT_323173 [Aplosporella prunicola CBS 121167]KAF2135221.1 hypothetical protein K452DRAFT_323173 [Aplosporella prunicola CBS 121167]
MHPDLKPHASPTINYRNVYVVHYNFSDIDRDTAVEEFNTLLQDLESVGLHTEVRAGFDESLLVFCKAPREVLGNAVHKSRVKDWLHGITVDHPGGDADTVVDGDFEAEDILSMYHLVTWSKELGGAGVTPKFGKWKNVESAFPLHNQSAEKELLLRFSKRILLEKGDLDDIRAMFGSKVAFYFAFLQTYLIFLLFPAVTGILAWFFAPNYSLSYAVITSMWCIVFLEYWKLQQIDLGIRWNVKGVGALKVNRPTWKYEQKYLDPATGEVKYHFPRWKHVARQAIQIPFILAALVILGALIALVFAVEIVVSEVYDGPMKAYWEYVPTVLLAASLPFVSSFLENIATMLTAYENHRTQDKQESSLTQKIFVLNFITNYLPIFLTAFVYVPFGDVVVPYLQQFQTEFKFNDFHVDPSRLRNEVIALIITGQLSNFCEELIFPYLKQRATSWYREYRASHGKALALSQIVEDLPDEKELLFRARTEAGLEPYNVQDDLLEMVVQFGYLSLFSPVWPLVPIGFLINNWIELRSDFLKICLEHQRPAPIRTDGIGPWTASLEFLTWMGSISTAAVVHLFGNDHLGNLTGKGSWYGLPITIFISEHIYLVLRSLVGFAMQRISSEQVQKRRNEEYARRKRYLGEIELGHKSGSTLRVEEKQRRKSILIDGGETFWTRQIEDGVSSSVGAGLITALQKVKNKKQV